MSYNHNSDSTLRSMSEEELYAMALVEVRNENRRLGLWAKLLSEAMGDEAKAEALYIRKRVAELTELQNDKTSLIYQCPNCKTINSISKDQLASRTSMTPPAWTFFCPACKQYADLRNAFLDPHLNNITGVPPKKPSNIPPANVSIAQPHKTGLAIASLVCSICGLAFPVSILFLSSIAGIICGHIALSRIKQSPSEYGGFKRAMAGLIIGYIALALGLVFGFTIASNRMKLRQMGFPI